MSAVIPFRRARRFPVLTPAQILEEQTRPYVVKGLIARGDHVIGMGQPGCGKSVIAPYVAYAVAQGRSVLGRRVKAGPVIYLASEDGHGMKNRIKGLRERYGDAPDFHLIPVPLNLMTDGPDRQEFNDLVDEIKPVLIVIDTLSKSFPGLAENDAGPMGQVVRVVRELTAICDAAVWSLHHVAKDAGQTPRGHGSLAGDADLTMLIEGVQGETRRVQLGKNRNGPSDISFAFDVGVEVLGIDEDGDAITAPIALEADPAAARPSKLDKLTDNERIAMRTLDQTIKTDGCPATVFDDHTEGIVVAERDWRARFYREGMPGAAQDTRKKAFNRAVAGLLAKGRIGTRDDFVWLEMVTR